MKSFLTNNIFVKIFRVLKDWFDSIFRPDKYFDNLCKQYEIENRFHQDSNMFGDIVVDDNIVVERVGILMFNKSLIFDDITWNIIKFIHSNYGINTKIDYIMSRPDEGWDKIKEYDHLIIVVGCGGKISNENAENKLNVICDRISRDFTFPSDSNSIDGLLDYPYRVMNRKDDKKCKYDKDPNHYLNFENITTLSIGGESVDVDLDQLAIISVICERIVHINTLRVGLVMLLFDEDYDDNYDIHYANETTRMDGEKFFNHGGLCVYENIVLQGCIVNELMHNPSSLNFFDVICVSTKYMIYEISQFEKFLIASEFEMFEDMAMGLKVFIRKRGIYRVQN